MLSRLGNPLAVVIAMVALLMATLNVNVAANVVSPANDFSNLWPRRISFRTGGLITCVIGVAMQPWKLLGSYGNYVTGWLVGYSGFLGPVAGILICDYFVRRKKIMKTEDLYRRHGLYEFSRGVNWKAILALAIGCGVAFVGLIYPPVRVLYDYAWFVGFGVSFIAYFLLTTGRRPNNRVSPPLCGTGRSAGLIAARWGRRDNPRLVGACDRSSSSAVWSASNFFHRDAIFHGAHQRAQIAPDAFFLDDSRHVHAEAIRIFLFRRFVRLDALVRAVLAGDIA